MSPQINPAILHALSLDPSTTKITPHGGSGFASTFRLTSSTTSPKSFFIKTSCTPDAATMFEGEHTSLNAIHSVVPTLCPESFAWGQMSQSENTYFLATEFLDLSNRQPKTRTSPSLSSDSAPLSLTHKLALLHTTPAPIPPGHSTPQFGFPVPTSCGNTSQPNQPYTTSWPDFFAHNRLLFILERAESRHGPDPELRSLVENAASTVVPRLLSPPHLGGSNGIVPVIVHGDLWSGNHGRGTFPSRTAKFVTSEPQSTSSSATEDVIFDPSSTYAHSEYELGIMRMFGGFDAQFMDDYHALVPKTEPAEEYEDRVRLYEVFHQLNHWVIFGGGYRAEAVRILKKLTRRVTGG